MIFTNRAANTSLPCGCFTGNRERQPEFCATARTLWEEAEQLFSASGITKAYYEKLDLYQKHFVNATPGAANQKEMEL